MKRLKKNILIMVATLLFINIGFIDNYAAKSDESIKKPKYVFMFIGDGLGASQRQISEYYLKDIKNDQSKKLLMNTFTTAGINTTHSADSIITDSAAAGTVS